MDDRTTIASGLYLAFTEDALRRRINPPRDECLDAMKQAVEEADMLLSELRRTAPTPQPSPETKPQETPHVRWRKMDDPPSHSQGVPVCELGDPYCYCWRWKDGAWHWHRPDNSNQPVLNAIKNYRWCDIGTFRPTEGDEKPSTPQPKPTRVFWEMSDHPCDDRNVCLVTKNSGDAMLKASEAK